MQKRERLIIQPPADVFERICAIAKSIERVGKPLGLRTSRHGIAVALLRVGLDALEARLESEKPVIL